MVFSGCAVLGIEWEEAKDAGPQEQIFEFDYDKVWRAAQLALARYPIKINNMDSGHLETDYIKRDRIWYPPYARRKPANGERHQITVRMVRGVSETNKEAVKVIVSKRIDILPDFFSEPKPLKTDGMEEKTILYRIDRELKVERALIKANEKEQAK